MRRFIVIFSCLHTARWRPLTVSDLSFRSSLPPSFPLKLCGRSYIRSLGGWRLAVYLPALGFVGDVAYAVIKPDHQFPLEFHNPPLHRPPPPTPNNPALLLLTPALADSIRIWLMWFSISLYTPPKTPVVFRSARDVHSELFGCHFYEIASTPTRCCHMGYHMARQKI